MSDDNTQAFIAMRAGDPDLEADNLRFKAAQQMEDSSGWYEQAKKSLAGAVGIDDLDSGPGRVLNWAMNMPKNIGIGTYRAAVNTIDTVVDFERKAIEAQINNAVGKTDETGKPQKTITIPSMSEAHPELMKSVYGLADEWAQNNKPEDDITQGIAQFTVPFLTWMKALGAGSVIKAFTAEAVASGTAYQPHEGRMADLVQMGRQLDGRFGDVLRSATPDGSAINAYINYMTDREGEGDWEGRFKNVIDNSVASAGLGMFIKTAGISFKAAKKSLEPAAEGAK